MKSGNTGYKSARHAELEKLHARLENLQDAFQNRS